MWSTEASFGRYDMRKRHLSITKEVLARVYDYLHVCDPFCRWNLPDSEEIVFTVKRDPGRFGWYRRENGRHHVYVSERTVQSNTSLVMTMAHEMIHVHEQHTGCVGRGEHSAAFKKWAEQVCLIHGFDPSTF